MLKKTLFLILTLTVAYFAESSPINVGTLEFNDLDVEYSDVGYENDEPAAGWAAILSKLISDATKTPSKDSKASNNDEKTSGLKKKKNSNKGLHSTHSTGDLNTFFKKANAYDHGLIDDSDESARADAVAAKAAVTKGKETRTYARGKKTTGFHRVQHKDEYKKDQEFYEQDETKGTINRAGAKALGTAVSAGAGFNKSSFKHDRQKGINGKQGYLDTGFTDKHFSEFDESENVDDEFPSEVY